VRDGKRISQADRQVNSDDKWDGLQYTDEKDRCTGGQRTARLYVMKRRTTDVLTRE
jgi:hypothetical protein